MYAVVVTFQIRDGAMAEFMDHMLENALTSQTKEPGCHRFDVCTDPDHPGEVFLYELYADRAAFDTHLESVHFKVFDQRVAPMIERKTVRTYSEVST